MVAYDADLVNAYTSERLVFRALEDNDDDKRFILDLNNDPITTIMSSTQLAKPGNRGDMEMFHSFAKKALLFVIACVPAPAAKPEASATREVANAASQKPPAPTPIGFVYLAGGEPTSSRHRNAMLGIAVAGEHRAKGYGGEMINWILDWGFQRAGLHRIQLTAFSFNPNALKLYRKLGFVEEGRAREALLYNRKWHDILSFALLEQEWEKLRG